MSIDNLTAIAAYELEWRSSPPSGVISVSYRAADHSAGSDSFRVKDAPNFAAYSSVLTSGSPVYYRSGDASLSTDPSFQKPGDYFIAALRGDNLLISWAQLTWSQSKGGVILFHLVPQQQVYLHPTSDPAEFSALAAAIGTRTPSYLRLNPLTVSGKPESGENIT